MADLLSEVLSEEVDQAVRGRDISPDGVRRTAAIVLQVACPARRKGGGLMGVQRS